MRLGSWDGDEKVINWLKELTKNFFFFCNSRFVTQPGEICLVNESFIILWEWNYCNSTAAEASQFIIIIFKQLSINNFVIRTVDDACTEPGEELWLFLATPHSVIQSVILLFTSDVNHHFFVPHMTKALPARPRQLGDDGCHTFSCVCGSLPRGVDRKLSHAKNFYFKKYNDLKKFKNKKFK